MLDVSGGNLYYSFLRVTKETKRELEKLGCRLMVGQRILVPYVRVRLLPSQPFFQVLLMARSSSGLGRRPLKAEIGGSNPLRATMNLQPAIWSVFSFSPLLFLSDSSEPPRRIFPGSSVNLTRIFLIHSVFAHKFMPIPYAFISRSYANTLCFLWKTGKQKAAGSISSKLIPAAPFAPNYEISQTDTYCA